MDDFMSDLLARAGGDKAVDLLYPNTCDHVSSMIADETSRCEYSSQSDDGEFSDSSSTCAEDDSDSESTDSESMDYPSYMSLYDSSGYSSSPTYIRGDCYSLTPPASPSLGSSSAVDIMKSTRRLLFSIDSIIGDDVDCTSDTCDTTDVPAQIFSSYSSADDNFEVQPTDSSSCIEDAQQKIPTESESELSQRLYWCHFCEDVCSDYVDACMHQNIHYGTKDPCRLRKSIFEQTGYVTRHETIPGYMEKVKCGFCETIIAYRLLKVHLQCHEGHVYEICDHEFPSLYHLRDHVKSQHGNISNICNVCNEQFSDRRELNAHSRQHKLCIYQCNICFRIFQTRHAQRIHQRTHTGSKPYVCIVPGCYKSFSQMLYLQLHLNSHRNCGDF